MPRIGDTLAAVRFAGAVAFFAATFFVTVFFAAGAVFFAAAFFVAGFFVALLVVFFATIVVTDATGLPPVLTNLSGRKPLEAPRVPALRTIGW